MLRLAWLLFMGMTIYRCPAELPEELPAYLGTRSEFEGASVEALPPVQDAEPGAFTFRIRRGEVEVKVHGGRDAGGVSAYIMGGAIERRLAKPSAKLYRDLEEALITWGARPMSGEEIALADEDW